MFKQKSYIIIISLFILDRKDLIINKILYKSEIRDIFNNNTKYNTDIFLLPITFIYPKYISICFLHIVFVI